MQSGRHDWRKALQVPERIWSVVAEYLGAFVWTRPAVGSENRAPEQDGSFAGVELRALQTDFARPCCCGGQGFRLCTGGRGGRM